MALTPEEVVNQKFTITKFRDGYDLDQVDDFLDGMVEQLRESEQEKERLTSELAQAKERIAELEEELRTARERADGSGASQNVAEHTIVVDAQQPEAPAAQAGEPMAAEAAAVKSSAMLQLALELHDKYIREAEERRDQVIKKAEDASAQLIAEAQRQRAEELSALENERKDFAVRIQELRDFESEYRSTLSSYIQAQLRDLEGSPEPKGAPRNLD